jgi:hypothetical protein
MPYLCKYKLSLLRFAHFGNRLVAHAPKFSEWLIEASKEERDRPPEQEPTPLDLDLKSWPPAEIVRALVGSLCLAASIQYFDEVRFFVEIAWQCASHLSGVLSIGFSELPRGPDIV